MTPERIKEAVRVYERARYNDRKLGLGIHKHRDLLPEWVQEGRRIYFRDAMRARRDYQGSFSRTEEQRVIRAGVPQADWDRVIKWAHDERQAHGVAPCNTSMLLHDDGIIDPVAVELAVTGKRVVRLSRPERLEAMRRLQKLGLTHAEISKRLGVSESQSKVLARAAR